eukprot:SAG22_NODE_125_length_18883_cov_12.351629_6_plen_452_part_00
MFLKTAALLTACLSGADARRNRPARTTVVHLIENGQCGEVALDRILVNGARGAGLETGNCADEGYTVEIGASELDVGANIPAGQRGIVQTLINLGRGDDDMIYPETFYARPEDNACVGDQIAGVASACEAFPDPEDPGICGSDCMTRAQRLMTASENGGCTILGPIEEKLNAMVSTCDGLIAVDPEPVRPGGGRGGGGGHQRPSRVRGPCAIGFCESGNCPVCQEGLECVAVNPNQVCAGACFGKCREIVYDCVTCDDLNWAVGTRPGLDQVCYESDGAALAEGGGCTAGADFATGEEFCRTVGARLCTADEVLAGAGRGTGCQHDSRMIWTSSRATADGSLHCSRNEAVMVSGNQNRAFPPVCVDKSVADTDGTQVECAAAGSTGCTAVRCCADVECGAAHADSGLCSESFQYWRMHLEEGGIRGGGGGDMVQVRPGRPRHSACRTACSC